MSTALIKHINTVAKTCHRLAVEEDYQISCLSTDGPHRLSSICIVKMTVAGKEDTSESTGSAARKAVCFL